MNLTELEKIIEVSVGETNFKLLSELGIDHEFADFGKAMLQLYDMAFESMGSGNIDPKRLIELGEKFNGATKELSKRVKFGKDQNGFPVTLENLFGEQNAVRPEYTFFRQCLLICFWIAERKLRMHYEDKSGKKNKFEAVHIGGLR